MERINISDEANRDTLLGFLLIEAITAYEDKHKLGPDALFGPKDAEKGVGLWADVKIVLNGHELDCQSFAEVVGAQLDRMIEERALKLLEQRVDDVTNMLEAVQKLVRERFPLVDREEW